MKFDRRWIKTEVVPFALMIVLLTAARSSVADHYFVPSGSMEYSLMPGDRVIVDKTAYGFRVPYTKIDLAHARTPSRGEIAVFDSPEDGKLLIKRIVAVGGDLVDLEEGHLSINGEPLSTRDGVTQEHFAARVAELNLADGGGPSINRVRVPAGKVLAIGDHRGNSLDGRYFGFVNETELYGRAVAIYYRTGEGFMWKTL
jgi:signal peptidase I